MDAADATIKFMFAANQTTVIINKYLISDASISIWLF